MIFLSIKKMPWVNLSVLILATMVAVLAGMVGYMYWQQNRVLQAVGSLSNFVASQFIKQPDLEVQEESEDDRESIHEEVVAEKEKEVEIVEDVDDLQSKTASELKDLLGKKGIPYGKRDSKTVLLQLLKASA
jgi:flagellar basal body-associated protein FliL